jgi:hypothetical protein
LSLSTLASPKARQKKLEEQIDASVADVFFSLHVQGEEEPVYISEVGERSAVRIPLLLFSASGTHTCPH